MSSTPASSPLTSTSTSSSSSSSSSLNEPSPNSSPIQKEYVFDNNLDDMLARQSKGIDILEARLAQLETIGHKHHEVRLCLRELTSIECDISKLIRHEVQRCKSSDDDDTNSQDGDKQKRRKLPVKKIAKMDSASSQ